MGLSSGYVWREVRIITRSREDSRVQATNIRTGTLPAGGLLLEINRDQGRYRIEKFGHANRGT